MTLPKLLYLMLNYCSNSNPGPWVERQVTDQRANFDNFCCWNKNWKKIMKQFFCLNENLKVFRFKSETFLCPAATSASASAASAAAVTWPTVFKNPKKKINFLFRESITYVADFIKRFVGNRKVKISTNLKRPTEETKTNSLEILFLEYLLLPHPLVLIFSHLWSETKQLGR